MGKRVLIFIDGQNLYHALRTMNLKEIEIDFDKLFCDCIGKDDELIRTYLFRPEKVQNFFISKEIIASIILKEKKLIFENSNNLSEIEKINGFIRKLEVKNEIGFLPKEIINDITIRYNEIQKWLSETKQSFSQTDYKYLKLSEYYNDFEIIKKGVLKVDPYNKKVIGEKGVDVALSVSMVKMALENKLDKIILFSGDYDHSEGVVICKEAMKKVHIIKLHNGEPPKNISSSRELLKIADKVINIYETDLKTKYKKKKK